MTAATWTVAEAKATGSRWEGDFLSVVTLAELRHGIERMAAGQRRRRLNEWLANDLIRSADFVADAFIVATAAVHGLMLVTHNVADLNGRCGR
jgi:predicted nucleic acid-binding protein